MKKKLPVLGKPTPASAQRDLAVRPVTAGSRPEFPTRGEFYRNAGRKAGMIGSATLLASGLAHADPQAQRKPAPPPPSAQQGKPASIEEMPVPPPPVETLANGSVDGQPLPKAAPKFKVFRSGGGIGPAEDMWQEEEVEAFINYTMAKEGKLAIQTNYQLDYDGLSLKLDGFDPVKNIGYEYVDKLDYDHDEFTKDARAKLDSWIKDKKVAILFIETKKNPDAATIKGKVVKFLKTVTKAPPAEGKLATSAPPPAPAVQAPPAANPPPPPAVKPAAAAQPPPAPTPAAKPVPKK